MTLADLLGFSARVFRGHRLRTALSVLGVAIGVASVIILTSLGQGAREYVTNEFMALGTNLLIVLPGKTETTGLAPLVGGAPHDLTLSDADAILKRIPLVREITPILLGTASAQYGERKRDLTVIGTNHGFLATHNMTMEMGQFLPAGELSTNVRVCALGAKVRRELFAEKNPLGELVRVGDYRFRVIGVAAPRGTMLGIDLDEMIEIPVAAAMEIFNRRSLFRIIASARDHDEIPAAKKEILRIIKERHAGEEDITIFTQEAVLATFEKILGVLTLALAGIAAISLSVAGIGIMNVMLVSVSERTAEIGLLKALGASTSQITAVFLAEAAILAGLGGLTGLAVGFGAGRVLQFIYPELPAYPPIWAVVASIVVSVAVGLFFGAFPARRAARMDPIAALARRT